MIAVMFISSVTIPVLMMIFGFVSWRFPPEPNGTIGYRTKRSQSSEKAWYFAQQFWGKLSLFSNIPVLILSALGMTWAVRSIDDGDTLSYIMLIMIMVQTLLIFVGIGITESRLKKL